MGAKPLETAVRNKPEKPASRGMQARGKARRAELLAAARKTLEKGNLDSVSMANVAETAGIPLSSAYHFFSDINDLWKELARTTAVELAAEGLDMPAEETWQALIRSSLLFYRSVFNSSPATRKLMLGPHTPPDIKNAACKEDFRFGTALWTVVRSQFVLPELADSRETFFKALLIADVFYSLSVSEHDQVTDEAFEEAATAVIAYLSIFLPTQLARADA